MATPAVISRTIAATWPAGPTVASRWPGRGLWAGERAAVRPSGNMIVFWISAAGAVRDAGASAMTRVSVVVTAGGGEPGGAPAPAPAAVLGAGAREAGPAPGLPPR